MEEFLENAIFGPKMFVFGYFWGGGKTIDLKNKVFGQVNHNHWYQRIKWFEVIYGDQEGFQGIFGRPGSSKLAIFGHYRGWRSIG